MGVEWWGGGILRVPANQRCRREALFQRHPQTVKSHKVTNDCPARWIKRQWCIFGRVLEPLFLRRTVAPEGKGGVGGRSTGSRKAERTLPHSTTFPISTVWDWNPAAGGNSSGGWPSNGGSPWNKEKDGKWNHIPRGRARAGRAA